jgi:hypothetical protein
MGRHVTIETLGDEVVKILAEALEDPSLWILSCQYCKTSQ